MKFASSVFLMFLILPRISLLGDFVHEDHRLIFRVVSKEGLIARKEPGAPSRRGADGKVVRDGLGNPVAVANEVFSLEFNQLIYQHLEGSSAELYTIQGRLCIPVTTQRDYDDKQRYWLEIRDEIADLVGWVATDYLMFNCCHQYDGTVYQYLTKRRDEGASFDVNYIDVAEAIRKVGARNPNRNIAGDDVDDPQHTILLWLKGLVSGYGWIVLPLVYAIIGGILVFMFIGIAVCLKFRGVKDQNINPFLGQKAPEQKAPDQESPDQETPDQETPDQETPEQETPEQETPDQETPEQETPEQETPEQETPDQETPDQETPDQETSDQETPDQETPDQETPDQETPEQEAPDQETPEQETPEQETPEQETPEQETPEQETPDQETPDQETPEQETPEQETPEQETPEQETPEQETPEQETPEQETPEQETPEQETPDQETPEQETPDQETPEQETPEQETPEQETSKNVSLKGEVESVEVKGSVGGLQQVKGLVQAYLKFCTLGGDYDIHDFQSDLDDVELGYRVAMVYHPTAAQLIYFVDELKGSSVRYLKVSISETDYLLPWPLTVDRFAGMTGFEVSGRSVRPECLKSCLPAVLCRSGDTWEISSRGRLA